MARARHVSPLSLRILAVNVAALLVLAVGLLYTGQYERGLMSTATEALKVEGRMIAAALAREGKRETLDGQPILAQDLARQVLRGVAGRENIRVIVFGKTGGILVDNHQLLGPGGVVEMVPLDTPSDSWSLRRRAEFAVETALSFLPVRLRLSPFPQQKLAAAQDYPGVLSTLADGSVNAASWRDQDRRILLTVSVPVQNLKNVMGAVLLMYTARNLETVVRTVQFAVVKIFLLALLVTILLSLYLSETIVWPIVRLAEATDRMRNSLVLKDSMPDLSWRRDEIGELSRAFREMTEALSDRIDSISRFASDVAHEIKNPLASVKSAVETISMVKDEKQREKLLAVINDDISRMNRLITDISNASRIDSELSRAEKRVLDLSTLIGKVVEAEKSRPGAADKIAVYLEEGLRLPVTGNEVQLAQVAHNLIDNALSFVSENGVVTVRAGFQGDKVFMHVDNPGPPIPESKLETVFERFYSERPKTEKFGLHSGLGLSICRQIVRMHRGEIFAQNLKDKSGVARGVRFTVLLPAGPGSK